MVEQTDLDGEAKDDMTKFKIALINQSKLRTPLVTAAA